MTALVGYAPLAVCGLRFGLAAAWILRLRCRLVQRLLLERVVHLRGGWLGGLLPALQVALQTLDPLERRRGLA